MRVCKICSDPGYQFPINEQELCLRCHLENIRLQKALQEAKRLKAVKNPRDYGAERAAFIDAKSHDYNLEADFTSYSCKFANKHSSCQLANCYCKCHLRRENAD